MNSQEQYKQKYLKYKNKYIQLKNKLQKNIKGGECTDVSGNPAPPLTDYEDPVNMSNLLDIEPDKRITINGRCYNIDDIYRWVITERKNTDPQRNPINQIDRQRIIDLHAQIYQNNDPMEAERARVLESIRKGDLYALRDAPEFQADRQLVLEALRESSLHLQYASPELRADREIVLPAIRRYGFALEFASPELRADREIVLIAVRRFGEALKYASPELQADREIVLNAVRSNGKALEYASPELQNDPEIIAAVRRR